MRRFLSVLIMCTLASAFAGATPTRTTLTPVKATHQRPQRHKAHKAGKHHTPKRHRHHKV